MKKKFLTIVLAIFMALSLVPVNKADALESITVDQIQQYIPDPVFAKAIKDAIDGSSFDLSIYDSVEDVLKNFDGTISISPESVDGYVKSIEGIHFLEKARVSLDKQSVLDLSPISKYNTGTKNAVSITKTPIKNWPVNFKDKDNEQWQFPTNFFLFGNATYVYSKESPKTQTIKYDVTINGETAAIDENDPDEVTGYIVTGQSTPSKEAPENGDTSATFTVSGKATSEADIALPTYRYMSGRVRQSNTPAYFYIIDSIFFYPVFVDTETNTVGGFNIVKYDAEAEEPTPLIGAEFTVTNEDGREVGVYTTTKESPIITVKNLPVGTYTITETKAPKGYDIDTVSKTVTIKNAEPSVQVIGGTDTVTANADKDTWTPDWSTGFHENGGSYDEMVLNPSVEPKQVTAQSVGAQIFITNKNVPNDYTGIEEIATVDVIGYASDELTGTAYIETYDKERAITKENTSFEDIIDIVNGYIDDNAIDGEVHIKVNGSFVQNEETYETVEFTDHKFTIWIENTTGDEGKYSKDAGGWVNIVGEPENNIASSFNEQNLDRRKTIACTQGRADTANGWSIDLDRIAVGPMGPDGKSGATYFIEGIKDGITEFEFDMGATEGIIKGHVEYDEKAQTIKICIDVDDPDVVLDRNIDVAVAFKKVQVAPNTGDSYNLYLYVTAAVTSLAACAYIFKKVIKA